MNDQEKNALTVIGIAILILIIFRPKKSAINTVLSPSQKTIMPDKSTVETAEIRKNAEIAIRAMRAGLNNGINQTEASDVQKQLYKKFQIKVITDDNGKLIAVDKNGQVLSKENASV